MKKNIFIGIDGGATKTKAIIEDDAGNLLGEGFGGPANIRLSVENSWQSILTAINAALAKSNLHLTDNAYNFHVGLGLAGCEIPEACTKFLQTPHPFTTLILEKDTYTSCVGAHAGKDGAIIIIGTGTAALQIQESQTVQIGGWGFPHDDIGSGAWIGLQAVATTLQWLDGRITQSSELLQNVFAKFANDLSQLVVWANQAKSTQFATIAPLVLAELPKQDYHAVNIIRQAATAIDAIGEALIRRTKNHATLPCVLLGGLAPLIEPWLSAELRARVVPCKYEAAKGAILLLKQQIES